MKWMIVILMLCSSTAFAHPCKTRHASPPTPLLVALKQGFGLTAGFRWDQECPDASIPVVAPRRHFEDHADPFFVGAELRMPLAPRAGMFANFDRDFEAGPKWNARIGGYFRPWR